MPTFASLRSEYAALWKRMEIRDGQVPVIDPVARKILANKARYAGVEDQTGVPWFWIGITHNRESGLSFKGHLHNGDPLTARTRQVPKGRPLAGRPPFTWEASAIDALLYHALDKVDDWSIERIAYEFERFNGWGYRSKAIHTPYLWSKTNIYSRGKYVADHVFSASAVDQQLGCMALLKRLAVLDPSIHIAIDGVTAPFPLPPDIPKPAPETKQPSQGIAAAIFAFLSSIFKPRP